MSPRKASSILETKKCDRELVSPEKFLDFSDAEKRDIRAVKMLVKPLSDSSLDDSDFTALEITWKTPKYKVEL